MIDLSTQPERVMKWMDHGVEKFLREHSGEEPTTIALYSSPVNGWISLCVDVNADSGALRTNCPDYTYPEYDLIEFPEWCDEYELDAPMIKRHDLQILRLDHREGDEAFNRPFFDFLMSVVNDSFHGHREVFRPVWAGAQILDSRLVSMGRLRYPKND